jgi:drug/metabolite transporter (DMT)-like permease
MAAPRTDLAYLQVAIAATAWGTWSLFLRPAGVDPRWSSAIMLLAVGLVPLPLLLSARLRGPVSGPPRRLREWGAIALIGVFDASNSLLFFSAMAVTSVAIAVLSHYLAPVLVAAAAPLLLGTPRKRGAVPLALLALLGLALVLEPWALTRASATAAGASAASVSGRPLLGAALGAGSAIFYAGNVFVTKRIAGRFTAEEQLVWHAFVSAALLAAVALATGAPIPTLRGASIVALSGALVGASSGLLYLRGLLKIPAEHAGILTFLEPLTAVLVAWIAWGERPGVAAAIGAAIVLGAGVFAIREPGAAAPRRRSRAFDTRA